MIRCMLICTVLCLLIMPTAAQESTILETLAERSELSQFNALLEMAEPQLLDQLNDTDAEFTIFAPTNAAFEQLTIDIQDSESWQQGALGKDNWQAVLEDSKLINEMLEMHIIPEIILWDDLLFALEETNAYQPYIALNGDFYSITATFDIRGDVVMSEGVEISLGASIDMQVLGIEASNGIIYLIDYPLIPEIRTIGEILSDDASYGEFLSLLEIIEAADMLDMLNDTEAEYTIFAPYDSVFESMDNFDELLTDSEAANAFLQHYIIPQRLYNFEIDETAEYESLNGDLLNLIPAEPAPFGEFFANDAYVVFANRVAKNGVIHEIETLMN